MTPTVRKLRRSPSPAPRWRGSTGRARIRLASACASTTTRRRRGRQSSASSATCDNSGLQQDPPPILYMPYQQFPLPFTNVSVRSSLARGDVAALVRAQLNAIDSNLPPGDADTLQDLIDTSIAQPRFRTMLVGSLCDDSAAARRRRRLWTDQLLGGAENPRDRHSSRARRAAATGARADHAGRGEAGGRRRRPRLAVGPRWQDRRSRHFSSAFRPPIPSRSVRWQRCCWRSLRSRPTSRRAARWASIRSRHSAATSRRRCCELAFAAQPRSQRSVQIAGSATNCRDDGSMSGSRLPRGRE